MSSEARSDFERKLVSGLSECGISKGSSLLVALSGGSDSTALLIGLQSVADSLGIRVEAAHFNHRTRDSESDIDEQFCRDLCERLKISGRFGSMADASSHSEESMRDARYRFLIGVATSLKSSGIVTAHTLDDQAETTLLALTRGAGLRGLTGMAHVTVRTDPDTDEVAKLFRPMLRIRESETAAYCSELGFTPREDPSNRDLRYARNRIRHSVIPELAHVNPKVVESISRLADNLREDAALIDEVVARHHARVSLATPAELSRMALADTPKEALGRILSASFVFAAGTRVDLEQVHIRAMTELAEGPSGRSLDLPNEVRMIADHDVIRFVRADSSDSDEDECPLPAAVHGTAIKAPGSVKLPDGSVLSISIGDAPESLNSHSRWRAFLNADLASSSFEIRSRSDGDRFQPLGMPSPMKLQDFMVNSHIPARWRDRVPLLITERGIAWTIGYRISEWAKVFSGAEKALIVEYTPASSTEFERDEG